MCPELMNYFQGILDFHHLRGLCEALDFSHTALQGKISDVDENLWPDRPGHQEDVM